VKIVSRTSTEFVSNTEVWHVYSEQVRDVLRVCISGPESPPRQGSVGAVYAVDAPWLAGSLVNTVRGCHLSGELPPLYSVSVGYPLDSQPVHLIQRTRDLTPTPDPDFDPVIPLMLGSTDVVSSGAAPAFLAFLLEELRPALEKEYPLDPAESTLAGASLGGLFTLQTLLSHGESFRRYLSISPSIWWDDGFILKLAETQVTSSDAPRAAVYMCAGELESPEHLKCFFNTLPANVRAAIPRSMASADMHADMRAMARILSAWRGGHFRVCSHIYAQESHGSLGGAALSRGLRALYGSLPW
jgi:predicted alpha/beta superfamily hydrolase